MVPGFYLFPPLSPPGGGQKQGGKAEGTFGFRLNNGINSYRFKYQITLYHDDIEVLHYILHTLGIGNVYASKDGITASFSVVFQSTLKILIAIFAKYNLNTTKHLDVLAFTSAYALYTQDSSRLARLELNLNQIKFLILCIVKECIFTLSRHVVLMFLLIDC